MNKIIALFIISIFCCTTLRSTQAEPTIESDETLNELKKLLKQLQTDFDQLYERIKQNH